MRISSLTEDIILYDNIKCYGLASDFCKILDTLTIFVLKNDSALL